MGVELDLWEGSAWVSIIVFRLMVRHRELPAFIPSVNFLELNLRTYVTFRGDPAIHFFRLYAGSQIGTRLARWMTPLPYAFARIDQKIAETRRYDVLRSDGSPLVRAAFQATGTECESQLGSLDEWLLERYRAYVPVRRSRLLQLTVEHPRWRVLETIGAIDARRLGELWGWDLDRAPDICHYSAGVDANVLPFSNAACGFALHPKR